MLLLPPVCLVTRYVEELVQQEIAAGIPSHRVVVAGFSQGGAVALMALRSQLKLAGVVGEGAHCCLWRCPSKSWAVQIFKVAT